MLCCRPHDDVLRSIQRMNREIQHYCCRLNETKSKTWPIKESKKGNCVRTYNYIKKTANEKPLMVSCVISDECYYKNAI